MNTIVAKDNTDLDLIFPEGKEVTIARPDKTVEKITVMPMPLRKWKKGFKYIAQIAPVLGFDLFGGTVSDEEIQNESGEALWSKMEKAATSAIDDPNSLLELPDTVIGDQPLDLKKLYDALMGDTGDLILEFMAFAIDKDVEWLGSLYDEAVDILAAVIEVNLIFFVQKLLPKILLNTRSVVGTAQQLKGFRTNR